MNTKYFAVLFFIVSAAAVELIDPFHKARHDCRRQFGLSREQLASSKNHLERVGNYIVCWIQKAGITCGTDGQLDPDSFVKVTELVLPKVISRLICLFCNKLVVEAHLEDPVEQAVYWAKCLKAELPSRLLDATGFLKKPIYPRLEQL